MKIKIVITPFLLFDKTQYCSGNSHYLYPISWYCPYGSCFTLHYPFPYERD